MSGRNPDDARHEDCGPAEVEHDLSEPDLDDCAASCVRCDGMIDLDDHGYKPHPESGEYLCEDCRDEEPAESERAADLESAFNAVLAELDGDREDGDIYTREECGES